MIINCDMCVSLFDFVLYSFLSSFCINFDVVVFEFKCEMNCEFVDSVTYESNKSTSVYKDAFRVIASCLKFINFEGFLFDVMDECDEMFFIFFIVM